MNSGSYFPQVFDASPSQELQIGSTTNVEGGGVNLASVVLVPSPRTDAYTDELLGEASQPLWQVQYYSETLEPSNVSLLAQTKQEEDDIFYATFPQARSRHWVPLTSPYSEYFGDSAFYLGRHDSGSSAYTTCPSSMVYNHESLYVAPSTPAEAHVSSELMAAMNLCGEKPAIHLDNKPTFISSLQDPLPLKVEPVDTPLAPQCLKVDIASANQVQLYNGHEPLMDYLSPLPDPSSPQVTSFPTDATNSHTVSSSTGTWPSMRIRSLSCDSVKSESPTPLEQSVVPASAAPAIIPLPAPSHPEQEVSHISKSAPAGLMRLSPLPANRRPAEKKKVSGMACNFCRKRKIACGPPLAGVDGTVEKTCNQCQRRSRECVFPTESRRGLRKKKASSSSAS